MSQWLKAAGAFVNDTDDPPTHGDFHAVWGDGAGNAFAVGGNYITLTKAGTVPNGVVARFGN